MSHAPGTIPVAIPTPRPVTGSRIGLLRLGDRLHSAKGQTHKQDETQHEYSFFHHAHFPFSSLNLS
jgi:hypothetical protein